MGVRYKELFAIPGRQYALGAPVILEEAAQVLGIGRNTAYEAVRTGEQPALKIGKRLLIPVKAIDALLASAVEQVAQVH